MPTQIISASEFRQNLANYINSVYYQKQPIVIKKHQIMVKLIPLPITKNQLPSKKTSGSWFGIWQDIKKPTLKLAKKLRTSAWKTKTYS